MSLRISDDRLCQDCDDLNRAAYEGRACAEQSGDDTETQSAPAASATTSTAGTTSTSATSSSKSIRNELLCYVANKMDLVVHDSLIKLCTDFYETKVIECAKQVLFDCPAVAECGVRHQRRQGPSKDKNNMEDILLVFHRCSDLPEFVAGDLSRLPPLDMNNIDFAHLLHEFQGMRTEMANMREEFKRCKPISQVAQRDEPWSKPNSGATVVNLPAMREDKSPKSARSTVTTPKAALTTTTTVTSSTVTTPKAALTTTTTVTSSTVTTPKAALTTTTTVTSSTVTTPKAALTTTTTVTSSTVTTPKAGLKIASNWSPWATKNRPGRIEIMTREPIFFYFFYFFFYFFFFIFFLFFLFF